MKALLWLGAVGLLLLAGMPFPVILALGVILYGIVFALAGRALGTRRRLSASAQGEKADSAEPEQSFHAPKQRSHGSKLEGGGVDCGCLKAPRRWPFTGT